MTETSTWHTPTTNPSNQNADLRCPDCGAVAEPPDNHPEPVEKFLCVDCGVLWSVQQDEGQ